MQKAKFWIKATICVVDLHQIFFYMSCIGCKKGTGYEQNEKFQCYHCKYMSNAQPRYTSYIHILRRKCFFNQFYIIFKLLLNHSD